MLLAKKFLVFVRVMLRTLSIFSWFYFSDMALIYWTFNWFWPGFQGTIPLSKIKDSTLKTLSFESDSVFFFFYEWASFRLRRNLIYTKTKSCSFSTVYQHNFLGNNPNIKFDIKPSQCMLWLELPSQDVLNIDRQRRKRSWSFFFILLLFRYKLNCL